MTRFQFSRTEHDPGGRVSLPLLRGCRGLAKFAGPHHEYRLWLERDWCQEPGNMWLWIGMNPSTARGDVDDPTVRKELNMTIAGCGRSYRKANVMDWRATDPRQLLNVKTPRSSANLATIEMLAIQATKIVCAWGVLPNGLKLYADETMDLLVALKKEMWCVGHTANGSPRHPLYVRNDTKLERHYGQYVEARDR